MTMQQRMYQQYRKNGFNHKDAVYHAREDIKWWRELFAEVEKIQMFKPQAS